jgi:hypothetical protein
MEPEASGIEAALDAWLAPFLDVMGRVTRRRWAPLYLAAGELDLSAIEAVRPKSRKDS